MFAVRRNAEVSTVNIDGNEVSSFRMIGGVQISRMAVKQALKLAGFDAFTTYGDDLVCSKRVQGSKAKVTVRVRLAQESTELTVIKFYVFDQSAYTLQSHFIQKQLGKVEEYLTRKAA